MKRRKKNPPEGETKQGFVDAGSLQLLLYSLNFNG
jgi:hypothetical protein